MYLSGNKHNYTFKIAIKHVFSEKPQHQPCEQQSAAFMIKTLQGLHHILKTVWETMIYTVGLIVVTSRLLFPGQWSQEHASRLFRETADHYNYVDR